MIREFTDVAELAACVGTQVARSGWMTIDQHRIDAFAEVTGDRQWIHTDAERCARESPFTTTIAHGFLTLSLVAALYGESIEVKSARQIVNYGFERLRFLAPVNVDSAIAATFVLAALERTGAVARASWDVAVAIRGREKPALAAVWITQIYE